MQFKLDKIFTVIFIIFDVILLIFPNFFCLALFNKFHSFLYLINSKNKKDDYVIWFHLNDFNSLII